MIFDYWKLHERSEGSHVAGRNRERALQEFEKMKQVDKLLKSICVCVCAHKCVYVCVCACLFVDISMFLKMCLSVSVWETVDATTDILLYQSWTEVTLSAVKWTSFSSHYLKRCPWQRACSCAWQHTCLYEMLSSQTGHSASWCTIHLLR